MGFKRSLKFSVISVLVLLAAQSDSAFAAEKPPRGDLLQQMKPSADKNAALRLKDALAEAYRRNPDLQAARAELRAVDEEYAQAVSGFRPSVEGGASYTSTRRDTGVQETASDPKIVSIEVTQPIYRGGSTIAGVHQSENAIKAQRALLKVKEQEILQSAVTSYVNVLRDKKLVELNINNEKVLSNHLEASQQRFKLGDITKTDVSQSESRLANARAARVTAEGNLKKSRAAFEKIIGLSPEGLETPSMNIVLPASLEQALDEAETGNPVISYAHYVSVAAEATTRSITGELLPQLDLTGGIDRTYDTTGGDARSDAGTVALRATIPLFSGGGSTYSRIRQSRQVEQQRRMEIRDTDRIVRQSVIDAWEGLASAKAEKQARQAQINAAKTALDGVRLETDYGSRTTLDLLDAEQEYLDAQVAHVIADHDQVVAAYALLATTGRLTAEALRLDTEIYDPLKNFQNVKNKWFGGKIGAVE